MLWTAVLLVGEDRINMNIITVIPARGASKGIKKKNIRPLNGKPLVAYSIEYSLKCGLVKRTIVSTDDSEIAQVAREYGAEVPFLRPLEFAQDDTPDFPVFKHALTWLKENDKEEIDILVLLRPTSPLRPPGLIEKGYALLKKYPEASSVRAVTLCREHPYRMFNLQGDFMLPVIKESLFEPYNIPRQKLPTIYFQTGDLEMVRAKAIAEENSISGKKILALPISQEEMLDIDDEKDMVRASDRIKKHKLSK